MKRKVIQHGPATLVVSLPSAWAKRYGVTKGIEVDVVSEGNNLRIGTTLHVPTRSATLLLDKLDRTLFIYALRSLYRFGFDTITLENAPHTIVYGREGKSISFEKVLGLEMSRLQGIEIIEKTPKRIVLQSIHGTQEQDFDPLLRRLFHIISDEFEKFRTLCDKPTKHEFESIELSHTDATRIASSCLRILNKKQHSTFLETSSYYRIVTLLDRIGDIVRYCARDIVTDQCTFTDEQKKYVKNFATQFSSMQELFFAFTESGALNINKQRYDSDITLRKLNGTVTQIRILSQLSVVNQLLIDLIESTYAMKLTSEKVIEQK